MAKNYFEQVAKMLGLELGERFCIKKPNGDLLSVSENELSVFVFTDTGLFIDDLAGRDVSLLILDLLSCNYTIVNLPFKHRRYENYWYCPRGDYKSFEVPRGNTDFDNY